MTNAEKYLKDGVSVEEFARVILEKTTFDPKQEDIIAFLNKSCKPTLTEDERVILSNMQPQPAYITRNIDNDLTLKYDLIKGVRYSAIPEFNHLFQFIKYGEEYSIEELLK